MTKRFSDIEKLKISHAQRYVDHIDALRNEKEKAESAIAEIEAMAMPSGIRYDDINVMTSPNDDAFVNAVAAMEDKGDYERLIREIDAEYEAFCLMVRYEIKSLGGLYLFYHFKYGVPWKEIAKTAGIDESTERNRRKDALLEMYDKNLVPLEYRVPVYRAI